MNVKRIYHQLTDPDGLAQTIPNIGINRKHSGIRHADNRCQQFEHSICHECERPLTLSRKVINCVQFGKRR